MTVKEDRIILIGAALIIVAGISAGLLLPGFGSKPKSHTGPLSEPLALPRPLADFELTNTASQAVSRADLQGKFVVVNFVFTSCSLSCLAVNDRMAEIQRATADMPDVALISLTVDPRSDTPESLAAFARRFGADASRWQFLTGDKPTLYNLLEQSFIAKSPALEEIVPGGFAHTDQIMLVDPQGSVCASFNGLSTNAAARVLASIEQRRTLKTFNTRGLVRSIADDKSTALIRHEAIPGYMPAMTMELNIRNPNELADIAPGDTVTFRLTATDESHWIDKIQKAANVAPANLAPAPATVTTSLELQAGDLLPDAQFLDEQGRTVNFADYRGRALAFTFFFTRCPLPDFCPLMNKNLASARSQLLADTNAPVNWSLMSISFDSEFDRPAVLAGYARTYRGDDSNKWLFASASAATLNELAPRLDLTVVNEGGSFSHNLRTIVIDARGRIHRQFDGNRWTAGELAAALREAATVP